MLLNSTCLNCRPNLPSQFLIIGTMFFISKLKFLSSSYLSVALQLEDGCLSEGVPNLGLMLTASFLDPVPASPQATVFMASIAARVIGLVIAFASAIFTCISICFENTCLYIFLGFTSDTM